MADLSKRFADCSLALHLEKAKIIYCKDENRTKEYPNTKFSFLGYDFCKREARNSQNNKLFLSFSTAMSKAAAKSMRAYVRQSGVRNRSDLSLEDIAKLIQEHGADVLPATVLDGEVVKTNEYPSNQEFCTFLSLPEHSLSTVMQKPKCCCCNSSESDNK